MTAGTPWVLKHWVTSAHSCQNGEGNRKGRERPRRCSESEVYIMDIYDYHTYCTVFVFVNLFLSSVLLLLAYVRSPNKKSKNEQT